MVVPLPWSQINWCQRINFYFPSLIFPSHDGLGGSGNRFTMPHESREWVFTSKHSLFANYIIYYQPSRDDQEMAVVKTTANIEGRQE